MVQVEDKIVSFDIFEKQFVCDLSACKGLVVLMAMLVPHSMRMNWIFFLKFLMR